MKQTDVAEIRMPDELALWPIGRLKPYERNPRTHSDEQITKIAASLLEFGWTNPILVDKDDGIIAGHGRLLAARELGMATVPVIVLPHLTEVQRRAYVIADNQLALDAGWDEDLLTEELAALRLMDFDLTLTGFDLDELAARLDAEEPEPPPAPEPPEDPVSETGDLWLLGDHRLLCGDAGSADDVDRLLAGAEIHLVNTDPPWNVNVQPRSAKGRSRPKDRPLENDSMSDGDYSEILVDWFGSIARVLLPGRCFYIYGGYTNLTSYPPALAEAELYFSQTVIWYKESPVIGRQDFMHNHEMIFYGWREGAGHHFYGPSNAVDVWTVKKVASQNMVHLTEKPVELATIAIRYSSRPGENVLDLFGGSGSTLIGAHQAGRRCFMMELDPAYTDVIVQRWQELTGEDAVLDGTDESFEAVTARREAARITS
jgi:DNA modification methylase